MLDDVEQVVGEGASLLKLGEPFWPAQLAVGLSLALYLTLPNDLTIGPTWVVPVVEGVLLVGLMLTTPRRHHDEPAGRRRAAIVMIAAVSAANATTLWLLVRHLVNKTPTGGHSLLVAGSVIWITNVIVFGLWYWELDRGGPGRRSHRDGGARPDFLFPQMTLGEREAKRYHPGFIDYLYVSFTNAAAFSPTDTMPLSPMAKVLMAGQSLVSLVTIGLVVARAVNILA